ncbi:MAG: hypothetical protein QOJ10_437, partial [Chloroflexota bacterium]|nr:hypothetical protein [Chloroflexota bacterium]
GLADRAQGPSFAVAAGLVKWGSRAPARGYASARQPMTMGMTYQKTVRWLRDFF